MNLDVNLNWFFLECFGFEYTLSDKIYAPKSLKVLEKPFQNFSLSYFPTEAVRCASLPSFCHPASLISASRGGVAAPH